MKNKLHTIAYLRVSTADQDLEKNKADILRYANERDLGKVEFIEEKVSGVTSNLILPYLSNAILSSCNRIIARQKSSNCLLEMLHNYVESLQFSHIL